MTDLENVLEPPAQEPASQSTQAGTPTEHVTHLVYEGRDIYLVGTAHVSQKSVQEVQSVIDRIRPDTVCVELDKTRYETLVDSDRFRKLDIFQVIRQKKALYFLATLTLTAYQRRIGEKLGVKPGAEMHAAVEAARAVQAELVLADRDIQATLKRSWGNLSFWNKMQLLSALIGGFFAAGEIDEAQIEELKDRDTITEMMAEFARAMPRLQQPLIDERDQYLMSAIQEAPGKSIVAVVGAGHVAGMKTYLGQQIDRDALSVIPPSGKLVKSLKWIIPTIVMLAFYRAWVQHQGEGVTDMLYAWVLPNSIAAGLFTIVAGGRPLTVLTAFIASPITSLIPVIGAGFVAAPVEAWLRKPTVEDCERVPDAITTLKGWYRNPFTRVLLVFLGATFGSAMGAWVGVALVVQLLKLL